MKDVRNASRVGRLSFLTEEQKRDIYQAALEILATIGMKVYHPEVEEMLLGAGCTKTQAEDFEERLAVLRGKKPEILKALERICLMGALRIYLLPAPPHLEYVIHNATRQLEARLYVKHGDVFTPWEESEKAKQFWKDVKTIHGIKDPPPTRALLQGAAGFKVTEGAFFRKLKAEMNTYFAEMAEPVMRLCMEGLPETAAVGTGQPSNA